MTNPLPIGVEIPPFGQIKGVFEYRGERYYWMAGIRGWEVMDAAVIERNKEITHDLPRENFRNDN